MINLRFFMKLQTYTMTAKFINHSIIPCLSKTTDYKTNITKTVIRLHLLNS